MRPFLRSTRRLTVATGIAAAVAAPLVAAVLTAPAGLPAYLADCATGEEGDLYTGNCVPYLVPNSPASASPSACPPGVGGAQCSIQDQPISSGPSMPAPPPPQEPEQELAEIATPGY